MSKSKKAPSVVERVDRRGFLRGAAGAAALAAQAPLAKPQQAERGSPAESTAAVEVAGNEKPGSDFMIDVIKSLGIEYCAANPGSSFRALHESMINYGGNSMPELLTCCHEESSAAMAHGYAKIEGKPMMIMAHGTVGLQHASMAIYNCYADRVPMLVVLGNILDVNYRRGSAEWVHSVQDAASLVRDFVKWDDTPVTLQHFAESAVRAYKISTTVPMEPVVIVADGTLQEEPIREKNLRIPKLVMSSIPQGDSGAVADAARILVAAENPVVVAGNVARTPRGIELLVELADTLQARVHDQRLRMNFPSNHPLAGRSGATRATPNITDSDAILALEADDLWGVLHRSTPINRFGMETRPITKAGAKIITVSAVELNHKSNYQDFGRYVEADIAVTGDPEATLPELIEAVRKLITPGRKRAFEERGKKIVEANRKAHQMDLEQAALAFDATPVSTARMAGELWAQVKNEDWSLVSNDRHCSFWPTRLWNFTKQYQFIGAQGGAGVGYNAPASVGAALANRKHGRLTVSIQDDGDFNYLPAVFWTAAHHNIPLLSVMHNNRAYHEERMYIQLYGAKYNRAVDRSDIGTALIKPDIDYATVAKGYGVYAEGPIGDPKDLGPAIRRGIERVKAGEPALIDVVTQPR
ncbi:MAG TPA: thiamine pyrophosphate-dependent enzyme [Bryobacteraceae bacterium]|nr:thiamine pyrophosphate-dependent enzyme [Bryobacteraceae bacterium]